MKTSIVILFSLIISTDSFAAKNNNKTEVNNKVKSTDLTVAGKVCTQRETTAPFACLVWDLPGRSESVQ